MTAVTVSQSFILALCLLLAPADVQEVRIDVVNDAGFQDTLLATPTDGGYELFDLMGPGESNRVSLCKVSRPQKDASVYDLVWEQRTDRIDLTDVARQLKPLSEATQQRIVHNDRPIRINQSGNVIFVHVTGNTETFVVH